MKMKKSSVLGLAAAGVLLAALAVPAFATRLGTLVVTVLTATTSTITTLTATSLTATTATVATMTNSTAQYTVVPATQTLTAGFTITADACGGLKRINGVGDLTSDTSNTLTAPSSSNAGCRMLIVNVDSVDTFYLDSNSLFGVTSAASLPIGPKGSISVWSDGTVWWHGAWTEY